MYTQETPLDNVQRRKLYNACMTEDDLLIQASERRRERRERVIRKIEALMLLPVLAFALGCVLARVISWN